MFSDKNYIVSAWQQSPGLMGFRNTVIVQLSDSNAEYPNYYSEYAVVNYMSQKETIHNINRLDKLMEQKTHIAKKTLYETIKSHNENKEFYDDDNINTFVKVDTPYIFNNETNKWELLFGEDNGR